MNSVIVKTKALLLSFAVFAVLAGIANAATLNPDKTSVSGTVQSGSAVNTVSDTHYLQVPDGMYATVTLEEGEFRWHHCDSASFRAYIGSRRLMPGDAVEADENATISVYITCVAARWCNAYNVVGHASIARIPVYYPSYHPYTDNWARQSYSIRVRFKRKAPDLSVSAIDLSASAVAIDESATLSFTIRNGGRLAAGVATVAQVFDGTQQLGGDIAVPDMAAGATSSHSVTLPKFSAGNHAIRVVSDATGRVDEANEGNNSAEVSLRAYTRTPVAVTFRLNYDGGGDTVLPVVAGNTIGTLPNVARRGYDFDGWWTAATGGTQIGPTEKITESRTFYARWNARTSTVALNRQGGSGGTRTTTATFDAGMSHISPPVRTGYVFGGYFSGLDGTGAQYYSADGDGLRTWDIDGYAVLYAKWTGIASTITFDSQGGVGGSTTVAAEYGETLPLIAPPVRPGWLFQGYYTEVKGGGRQYYGADGGAMTACDATEAVTLYAHWLPLKMEYAVSLDSQGGVGGQSLVATYGALMPEITPPTRALYAFKGYFSAPNGAGTQYYNADGSSTTTLDVIDLDTLYAYWERAYSVILDPNGADGTAVTQHFTLPDWTLAANTFTSNGCVFAGWATEPDGAPVYPDCATLTQELLDYGDAAASQVPATLYAKWGKPLATDLFPGFQFVTGGADEDCGWFEESGELRSTRKAGLSWLATEIEDRGEFMHSATNAAFSLFSANEIYTNSINGEVTHDLSPRRHLAVWSVEKGMLTLYGAIKPTEDENTIDALAGQCEAELESKVQEFSSLVRSVLLRSVSSLTEEYCRTVIEDVVETWLQNGTCSDYVYFNSTPVASFANDVMTSFSRRGNNVYYLNRALESSSAGVNDCAVEIMNAISDLNAIAHWRAFHAALTEMKVYPKRLVAFAGEESADFKYMLDAIDGIERDERLCLEYAKPLIEDVVLYLVKGNSWVGFGGAETWEGIMRGCLADLFEGEATASDGTRTRNFYLYLKKSLFNSGYNTSYLEYAVDPAYYWRNSSYLVWLFDRVQQVIDEIAALQDYIVNCGIDEWRFVYAGAAIDDLPEPEARDGYTFSGWFPEGGGEKVALSTRITGDTLLHEKWERNEYTVAFNADGATSISPLAVLHGEALGALPALVRDGYTLEGWYSDASGENAVSAFSPITANMTLYALWTKDPPTAANLDKSGSANYDWGGGGGSAPSGHEVLEASDIVAPYAAPKAMLLAGAIYDGDNVAGIVELKLGKVNAKKKSSKVSGLVTTLDGKKHTIKSASVTDVDGATPKAVSLEVKDLGPMAISIGGAQFAGSLGAYHVQSMAVGGNWTENGAAVYVDAASAPLPSGTLEELLPNGEPVIAKDGKWAFNKAASVKWAKPKKGAATPEIFDAESGKGLTINTDKGKTNLSAMKLSYTPKKGIFKGSFKVYALEGSGKARKLKKYSFKVSGVVVGGVGSGKATCKNFSASWPVTVR